MNLRKVAAIANVSAASVSKALRGKKGVSEATRKRVLTIADQLGYRAQAAGRALVTGRRQVIGLVCERECMKAECLGKIQEALTGFLSLHDYHTMVLPTDRGQQRVPASVLHRMVDGLVLMYDWSPSFLAELVRCRMPAVIVIPDRETQGSAVRPDDSGGAILATRHLIELGHRRIAFWQGDGNPMTEYAIVERWRGYVNTMGEAGLPVYAGGDRVSVNRAETLQELFFPRSGSARELGPPTGLVCVSDIDAAYALQWFARQGIRVPRDVSLVGFDDDHYGKLLVPPLTTVKLPVHEMGREAGRLLLEHIEHPEIPPQDIVFPETLIVRESTAPPPGQHKEAGKT